MITKEMIKCEIDKVQDDYLEALFKIIKAFEEPTEGKPFQESKDAEWKAFVNKFAGCMANDPIKRGDQGTFELREKII
jgi:hypothetical protein